LEKQMATPRKNPEDKLKVGRKPTPFRQEWCDQLIKHMGEGNSFESFGAITLTGKSKLYEWLHEYPEFMEAKQKGLSLSLRFWENLAKMQAAGLLRRIKSETPLVDSEGRPMRDPDTGQMLMRREYEPAQGNPAALIFMLKNLHGFRDARTMSVSGDGEGSPIQVRRVDQLTPAEKMKEILEMQKFLQEIEGDGSKPRVIEHQK
jgi:hypothetical protein